MSQDTKLQQLVINKLTTAQYEAALEAGTIDENQLYMTTDSINIKDVKVNGTSVVSNNTANIVLGSMATETTSNYYTKTVADSTFAAKSLETTVSTHLSASNPHNITKSTIGLGNVDNTSDANKPISTATQTALNGKVSQVSTANKVYGTNSSGAQTTYDVDSFGKVNDVKVGTTSVVSNKIATLGTMAGETASNYSTKAVADTLYAEKALETTVANKVDKTSSASKVYGTNSSGNQTTYDVDSFGKVDDVKVGTTSVVTNKIATLGTMAGETASNYYKKTDMATIATSGSWNNLSGTPTTISGYGITDAYTKTEIDGKLSGAMHYKGTVATVAALENIQNPAIGDMYNVTASGANYAWNGTSWDKLSENIDLSAYDSHIANKSNPHEVTKAQVGLGNVDNTSDLNKPISTATQTALNGKVSDVKVGTTSVVTNMVANLGTMAGETASNYSTKAVADTLYADIAYENTIDTHIADKTNPHEVTKAQVGLGNVDNTSDANKPISTATQTALNGKQATLVSGTNIKTINNTSLLGSGNININSAVWGNISGTLSDQTDLNTALNNKQDKLTAGTNITITNNVISAEIEDYAKRVVESFTATANQTDFVVSNYIPGKDYLSVNVSNVELTSSAYSVTNNGYTVHLAEGVPAGSLVDIKYLTDVALTDSGATFIPSVSKSNYTTTISWTNDRGLNNPSPVQIYDGVIFTPSASKSGVATTISWTNNQGKTNPSSVTLYDGATYTPTETISQDGNYMTLSWTNDRSFPNPQDVTLYLGQDNTTQRHVDTFTATANQTQFVASKDIIGKNILSVNINNTELTSGAYSIGNDKRTVTIVEPVEAGATVELKYFHNLIMAEDGVTFEPHVSKSGYTTTVSWTNDGGWQNPNPVNILDGIKYVPSVSKSNYTTTISWSNDQGATNPNSVNILDGVIWTPAVTATTGGYNLSWTNNQGKTNPSTVFINSVYAVGAYSSSSTYVAGNLVTYEDSNYNYGYIAKQSVPAGTSLTNTTYWTQAYAIAKQYIAATLVEWDE